MEHPRQVALQAKLWACTTKPHVMQVGDVRDRPFLEDFLHQLTSLLLFSGILLFNKSSLFLLTTLRSWCSLCPESQEPGIWCPLNLGPWPITTHVFLFLPLLSFWMLIKSLHLHSYSFCEVPRPFPPLSFIYLLAALYCWTHLYPTLTMGHDSLPLLSLSPLTVAGLHISSDMYFFSETLIILPSSILLRSFLNPYIRRRRAPKTTRQPLFPSRPMIFKLSTSNMWVTFQRAGLST